MRSNICLWLTSLLLLCINLQDSIACGPNIYYPYGYRMYRVHDAKAEQQPDQITENCRLWQKLTSSRIPLSDIRQVVYKYTLDQMNTIMSVESKNAFASWIKKHNEKEILDFLILAKKCEKTRSEMLDPWYYPSKNDGSYLSLSEIEETAKAYTGKRLKDRYVLQAARAMMSAQKYQELVDYWHEVEPSVSDSVIKDMITSYVCGAYARINKLDEAMEYFIAEGDLNSIMYCLRSKGEITDFASELECVNRYAPDSEQVPEILQDVIAELEPWGSWDCSYKYRRDTSLVANPKHYYESPDKASFDKVFSLAKEMIKNQSSNKALWYYTAAFLADLDAKPQEAWKYIQQASKHPASEYLEGSIRVMKMYLDAKVSTYNSAYEARLYKDLQWLDNKIKSNIDDSIKEKIRLWGGYDMRNNISQYYWNDMLRRILLAEICPRMIDRGMTTRALQLANIADNRLITLCGIANGASLKEHRSGNRYNDFDFEGDFHNMTLEVEPDDLAAYIKQTQSNTSAFDRFLNERGYTDDDYLNDVLGTSYLAARNYSKALKSLSKVSAGYQKKLNTDEYMGRDPFSLKKKHIDIHPQYKLEFAKEMVRLEQAIKSATDPNMKGMDMIRYATGIKNSYTLCWPLTRYEDSRWSKSEKVMDENARETVIKLYEEGLAMIENEELAAIAHVQLYQWKEAVEKYPETYASLYTQVSCDNLCNYSLDYVVRRVY